MRKLFHICFIFLLYVWVVELVLFRFVALPGINNYDRAKFSEMVYGQAYRPFVYRTLLPSTVRIISTFSPQGFKRTIQRKLQKPGITDLIQGMRWENEYLYEYFVACMLMFGCLIGFALVLRRLIQLFCDLPPPVADFAPLAMVFMLPRFFRYSSYLYDPPSLFLFSSAILLIAKRKYWGFYLTFILATINKETALFLVGVFFVREFKRMPNRKLFSHLCLQVSLWTIIKGGINFVFRENPGMFMEFWLSRNIEALLTPSKSVPVLGMAGLFSFLVVWRWKEKPLFLRRGLLVTLIPTVGLGTFWGFIDEIRIFYEVVPFLFLLSLSTIVEFTYPLKREGAAQGIAAYYKEFS